MRAMQIIKNADEKIKLRLRKLFSRVWKSPAAGGGLNALSDSHVHFLSSLAGVNCLLSKSIASLLQRD